MTRAELRRQLETALSNAPISWVVAGQNFVRFGERILEELDKADAYERLTSGPYVDRHVLERSTK